MIRLLLIPCLMLSGCATVPELSTGSKVDLATTAIALSMGAKEVGLASVCGNNPIAVLTCAYGLKVAGEHYLGSQAMDTTGKIAGAWNATQILKMAR
jgi:NO-binding membrane sensor protein with MHYT domain